MFIYKICNIINGKIYIGLDTSNIKQCKRWKHHIKSYKYKNYEKNKILYKAMRKYGIENFIFEIIDMATNHEELRKLEKFWIIFYNSAKNGYNMNYGGGSPLLEKLPHYDQIRLRESRRKGPRWFNHLKWYNKTVNERKEIVKNTLHTDQANKKRSITIKEQWNTMNELVRENKLRGLKTWRNNLNRDEIKKIAISHLPKPKTWIVTDPSGKTFEIDGLGGLSRAYNINLHYAAKKGTLYKGWMVKPKNMDSN